MAKLQVTTIAASLICLIATGADELMNKRSHDGHCPNEGTKITTNNFGDKRIQNNFFTWRDVSGQAFDNGYSHWSFRFFVKGRSDVYISMSSENPRELHEHDYNPMIVIGGWENRESGVICGWRGEWTKSPSLDILSSSEMREFVVTIERGFPNDFLTVRREGEEPFLSYHHNSQARCQVDTERYGRPPFYFGVASGWGNTAYWELCGSVGEF